MLILQEFFMLKGTDQQARVDHLLRGSWFEDL